MWRVWREEGEGKNISAQLYQREKSNIKIKVPTQMLSYVVRWLFLIVKLRKFGAKYNQRMEGTPGREVLLGLKWMNLLLVLTFKVGHMLLFGHWGQKTQGSFFKMLIVGRHTFNLVTPSAGSLFKDTEKKKLSLFHLFLALLGSPFLCWH